MQPVLVILSPVGGLIYVNGRLVGEVQPDNCVSLPVAPQGVLYIEYLPLAPGYPPITRRITFSGGAPVAAALEDQADIMAVCWPMGVVEIEIAPKPYGDLPTVYQSRFEDILLTFIGGNSPRVELVRDSRSAAQSLPPGAKAPEIRRIGDMLYLIGEAEDKRYALAFAQDLSVALNIEAKDIELAHDGAVRALIELYDSVGHARQITWSPAGDKFEMSSSETMWSGGPNWPATPQDTAVAAAEAVYLDLMDEAEAYFAPNAQAGLYAAREWIRSSSGVTKLKYPLTDGRQAIGVLRVESVNLARVEPLFYHALPMGGVQGQWRLDRFEPATAQR